VHAETRVAHLLSGIFNLPLEPYTAVFVCIFVSATTYELRAANMSAEHHTSCIDGRRVDRQKLAELFSVRQLRKNFHRIRQASFAKNLRAFRLRGDSAGR
jgi:hypothetical protein